MLTEHLELEVIAQTIDDEAALMHVNAVLGEKTASIDRLVYYPYYHFTANGDVPTLFGRRKISLNCLVDGVTGLGATADSFTLLHTRVRADTLLLAEVSATDAERVARSTITHQMGRKLRMIASFQIDLAARDIVYKVFWIVRAQEMLIMVDGCTGKLHPLRSRAA